MEYSYTTWRRLLLKRGRMCLQEGVLWDPVVSLNGVLSATCSLFYLLVLYHIATVIPDTTSIIGVCLGRRSTVRTEIESHV